MNAINPGEGRIASERQSFIKSPKDLLGSLVETRADGSLEFVHLTAKIFLLEEGHVVPSKGELTLANLCIDYLNLPAFVYPPTREGIFNGDYGFLDYAILFWLRHLEVGAILKAEKDDEEREKEALMTDLAESLGIFIEQHWNSPTADLTLAKRHSDKIYYFRALPFYDRLEQAVASTKRQLKHFGKMKEEEIALNLADTVCKVRKALEDIMSDEQEPTIQQAIKDRYGSNLFKCPRFSCQFFTVGFPLADERDKHMSKHERPFRCSDEKCVGYTFGFSSIAEREKHMKENHLERIVQDEEFPTEEDVERSIVNHQVAADTIQDPDPQIQNDSRGDTTTAVMDQGESHICSVCRKDFARVGDLRRHMSTHTGQRRFICSELN
ncbi:hypothetical protein KJ359_002989 [Pestalotiopsis sp. 9143b]|nr:hypothetical protein KJ359_002989 [Pestalotiopsis sp. 9143b]